MSAGSCRSTLDDADGLDELAPVDRAQEAQAADAVADRNLVRRLLLVLELDQLFDRQMRFREPLFDPGQCQGQGRRFVPADRRASSATNALPIGGDDRAMSAMTRIRLFGSRSAISIISIGPGIGQIALAPAGGNPNAHATKILDQGEPQHDRNGPELAELQRGHRLVGGDEALEASASTRPSPCEIVSSAMSYTRGRPVDGPVPRRGSSRL